MDGESDDAIRMQLIENEKRASQIEAQMLAQSEQQTQNVAAILQALNGASLKANTSGTT